MMPDRRQILTATALLSLAPAGVAAAQTGPAQTSAADEIVELWPGPPPGDRHAAIARKVADHGRNPAHPDRWITGIARPVLVVKRPAAANGAAVLLMPGGGYGFLSYDNEGIEQAAWLNARGVTCFILLYRLPAEGWDRRAPVPLQDAQRAMRIIRARATTFGVQADKVVALGFSAGGHLAGSLATRFGEAAYAPVDAADRLSARPDAAGLIYPVVSLAAPFSHAGSRDMLLGANADAAARHGASVEERVDATTPPLFLVHAEDDGTVPVANSVALFTAMQAAKRPAALHIFEEGGHGFGARLPPSMPASAWPTLFAAWATRHGLFPASAA